MAKGINKNMPCTCGSGKKYKNCCLRKRKQRTVKISLDPKNIAAMDGIGISFDGQFYGIKNGIPLPLIGNATIEYGYQKKYKFKSLAKGPIPVEKLYINPNISLLEFEHVFAIDTNTTFIGNHAISVAAVLHCILRSADNKHATLKYSFQGCLEYHNIEGKPENLAWMELCKFISNDSDLKQKKIGLLVDSDLGNHESFNSRELPIYGTYCLPRNISLVYCSTDGGKENVINRLIAFCDKKANEVLTFLKNDGVDAEKLEEAKVSNKPYSHFRQWFPKDGSQFNLMKI